MAKVRSQSLKSMTVTALRRVATVRGIKGLSKADRETCYRVIRSTAVAAMSTANRERAYAAQLGIGADMFHRFTPAQRRRIDHKAKRATATA